MLEPPLLEAGDTIAIIAPASWCKEGEVRRTVHELKTKGFRVKLAKNIQDQWGYFAGSDEARAQGIMDFFKDDDVKAIWCLRGGYGSGRLLGLLDYETIRKNPKIFIGMSDITALHIALNQKAHLTTYLGPNANFLFAPPEGKDRMFAEENTWKVILRQAKSPQIFEGGQVLVAGKARGVLTGGNLALIVAHIGTPWQIETERKILLLEDVSEFTYRIDRFLCQMKQAGLLDAVAGVILSSWEECEPQHAHHFELEQVLRNYFAKAPYPVLLDFPSGHIEDQVTLPLGKEVLIDTDVNTVMIL